MNKIFYTLILSISLTYSLTALAFAASKEQRESGEEPTMKIYYEEFSSVPYGPTTAESIEKWQDLLIWFYGDHQFIGNFKKLLEKKKTDKSIDDKKIRLKAVIKNGDNESIYLVDYYGIVAKSDTKYTYILTKEELKKINDELVYFHGVVDQRPTISPW